MSQILKLAHENQQLKRQINQYQQVLGVSPYVDDSLFKGGYRVVKTIADRDAIKCCWRKQGMKVVVIGEDHSYKEYTLLSEDCSQNEWELGVSMSDILKRDYTWFINSTDDYQDKTILIETNIEVDESKDRFYLIEVGTTDGKDSFFLGFTYNHDMGYYLYRQDVKTNLFNSLDYKLPFNSFRMVIVPGNPGRIAFIVDSIKDIRIKISGGEKDLANNINLITRIVDYTNQTLPDYEEMTGVYENAPSVYNSFIYSSYYSSNSTGYYFQNYKNFTNSYYQKGLLIQSSNGLVTNINKVPIELLPYTSNGRNIFSNAHTVVGGAWSYGISPDKIQRTDTGFKVLGLISSAEMCVKTRINFNKETMKFVTVTGKLIGDYSKINITIGPQDRNGFPTPYTQGEFYIFPNGNFIYTFNLGKMLTDYPVIFPNPTWFDLLFYNKGINNDGNAVYEVKYLKIEEGELSTPWSPAYEDFGGGGANISNTDLTNTRPRIFTQNASFTWDTLGNPYYLKGLADIGNNYTGYPKVLRVNPSTKQVVEGDALIVTIPDTLPNPVTPSTQTLTIVHTYTNSPTALDTNVQALNNFIMYIGKLQFTNLTVNDWNLINSAPNTASIMSATNGIALKCNSIASFAQGEVMACAYPNLVLPANKDWCFVIGGTVGAWLSNYNIGVMGICASTATTNVGVLNSYLASLSAGWGYYSVNHITASTDTTPVPQRIESGNSTCIFTKVGNILNITVRVGNSVKTFNVDVTGINGFKPLCSLIKAPWNDNTGNCITDFGRYYIAP